MVWYITFFDTVNTEYSDNDVTLTLTVTRPPGRLRKNHTEEKRERRRWRQGKTQLLHYAVGLVIKGEHYRTTY